MVVIVGKIGPFDETAEKFSDYANRFVSRVAQVFLRGFQCRSCLHCEPVHQKPLEQSAISLIGPSQ